jgi:hypothetical protein
VHRERLDVTRAQPLDESVGAALGADEDEGQPARLVMQLAHERVELGVGGD